MSERSAVRRVAIAGAGGYGRVLAEYLRVHPDWEPCAFLDDDPSLIGEHLGGIPVAGKSDDFKVLEARGVRSVLAPIGHNGARHRILSAAGAAGLEVPRFVHDAASLPPSVDVDRGVIVLDGACFMPFATVKEFSIVSMGSNIAHHTTLERASFVSTGVNVGANVTLGEGAFVGIGATIMTGVETIGAWSVVGAGAVVIEDVEPNTVVAGVPARVINRRPEGWQHG